MKIFFSEGRILLVSLILAAAPLPACSSNTTPAQDLLTRDGAKGGADGSAADLTRRDALFSVDKARPREAAATDLARIDGAKDPLCTAVICGVVNDCCDCDARQTNIGPPPPLCTTPCKQNSCEGLSIGKPFAYCLKGKCFLGAGEPGCSGDQDCQVVDNCCDCLALPKKVAAPSCPPNPCLVNTCQPRGMSGAIARCISGVCRFVP